MNNVFRLTRNFVEPDLKYPTNHDMKQIWDKCHKYKYLSMSFSISNNEQEFKICVDSKRSATLKLEYNHLFATITELKKIWIHGLSQQILDLVTEIVTNQKQYDDKSLYECLLISNSDQHIYHGLYLSIVVSTKTKFCVSKRYVMLKYSFIRKIKD